MRRTLITLSVIVFIALVAANTILVHAQSQTPPNQGAWEEVVDAAGNIRYDNLVDLGVQSESPDWMQLNLPGGLDIPLEATYHTYQTPSGNIVVLPSATTLFFMALDPEASGLNGASSSLGSGIGTLEMLTAGFLTPKKLSSIGYASSGSFFSDVIAGKTNIWSAFGLETFNFLRSLVNTSLTDQQLYTMLLLYTPDMCSRVPGGCPPDASLPKTPAPPPNANDCGNPVTSSGQITVTAQKNAPNNALVVGQDPARVGVDLTWTVRVEPTTYTWWEKVPKYDWVCGHRHNDDPAGNCKTRADGWYNDGILRREIVGYRCVQHTSVYPEALTWATAYASLARSSRDWILSGDLQTRYPGAYLHQPDFSFAGFRISGVFDGSTYVWTMSKGHVQVADPGYFDLSVAGSTTGTARSNPRPFHLGGGQFPVYLLETTIIQ